MQSDKFYAVAIGRKPGIYQTWAECDREVKDFKGAKYRKFTTYLEANDFIKSAIINTNTKTSISNTTSNSTSNPISNTTSNPTPIITQKPKPKSKPTPDILHIGIGNNVKEKVKTIIPRQNMLSGEYCQDSNYSPKIHEWNKFDNEYYIFTDGSYKSSSKDGKNKSGISVYITPSGINIKNIAINSIITNNICELTSILYSFQIIIKYISDIIASGVNSVTIISDSEYSVKSITVWSVNWKKNNWKTSTGEPVKNKHIIEAILECMDNIREYNLSIINQSNKLKVKLGNIRSHLPEEKSSELNNFLWHGNNIADLLAQDVI
jgi:ribonuclease HI